MNATPLTRSQALVLSALSRHQWVTIEGVLGLLSLPRTTAARTNVRTVLASLVKSGHATATTLPSGRVAYQEA